MCNLESKANSESSPCHSELSQESEETISHASRDISNYRPQYDKVLESYPRTSLESSVDSENPSGEARPLRSQIKF